MSSSRLQEDGDFHLWRVRDLLHHRRSACGCRPGPRGDQELPRPASQTRTLQSSSPSPTWSSRPASTPPALSTTTLSRPTSTSSSRPSSPQTSAGGCDTGSSRCYAPQSWPGPQATLPHQDGGQPRRDDQRDVRPTPFLPPQQVQHRLPPLRPLLQQLQRPLPRGEDQHQQHQQHDGWCVT